MIKIEGSISNIIIYPNNSETKWFVRCKVDDEQKDARQLKSEDANKWNEMKKEKKYLELDEYKQYLADKYFKNEINGGQMITSNKGRGKSL